MEKIHVLQITVNKQKETFPIDADFSEKCSFYFIFRYCHLGQLIAGGNLRLRSEWLLAGQIIDGEWKKSSREICLCYRYCGLQKNPHFL
jgi:hypothetical protein